MCEGKRRTGIRFKLELRNSDSIPIHITCTYQRYTDGTCKLELRNSDSIHVHIEGTQMVTKASMLTMMSPVVGVWQEGRDICTPTYTGTAWQLKWYMYTCTCIYIHTVHLYACIGVQVSVKVSCMPCELYCFYVHIWCHCLTTCFPHHSTMTTPI